MENTPGAAVDFKCGKQMKNRFMLAPLTNKQSEENGLLSDDEYTWLVKRAEGQFGLVMTCASHVQAVGKGFSGQLGIFSDEHKPGHKRLVDGIKSFGALAVIQLHHAGMRSPQELIGEAPVCPSAIEKYGCRALSLAEVEALRDDFIRAAKRSQECGYDGVEIHGAHGYILTQFLSQKINARTDKYGGSLENRARLIFEIMEGVRESCGKEFLLGIRLSPERFGMDIEEVKWLSQRLIDDYQIDFLDISLWDCFKMPEEEKYQDKSLLNHFTELDFKGVKFTVAGNIRSGKDVTSILNAGVDFVSIGRSGILHHDFPDKVLQDPDFEPISNPVSPAHLKQEGLSDTFVEYMRRWPGFVE
jgi:2,4-dienoyl-CoA reductase-like NADH-dependent reductase (Old Yellow Enzyme family)